MDTEREREPNSRDQDQQTGSISRRAFGAAGLALAVAAQATPSAGLRSRMAASPAPPRRRSRVQRFYRLSELLTGIAPFDHHLQLARDRDCRSYEVAAAGRSPAIVLDIDETALSNWTRIYRDDFVYLSAGDCYFDDNSKPCGDLAWQRSGKAPAIGSTLKLYKFARCIDASAPCTAIEVFFITGRKEKPPTDTSTDDRTPRQWTRDNLVAAGYVDVEDDHLFLRGDNDSGVADYKTKTRGAIEAKFKVRIIANIGDQQSDLDGGYADRPFKLPNPFYFSR
jgi:hypothetical protein